MAFLTTAVVGLERSKASRPDDGPGLLYWRRVADGADGAGVGALRSALLELELADATKRFIHERSDERLRRELVQRVDWRCGEAPLADLAAQLEGRVAELCADEFDIPLDEGSRVAPHLLLKVLETSASQGARVLRHADLRALAEAATRLSVPRAALEGLFRLLGRAARIDIAGHEASWDASEPEDGLPLPRDLLPRPAPVAAVAQALLEAPIAVIHGGTGMGKTMLARLVARRITGAWRVLDLRGSALAAAGDRLLAYARGSTPGTRGLIADDVPDLDLADERSALVRAARTLAARGQLLILTASRPPGRRLRGMLALPGESVVNAPALTREEVLALVREAGGGDAWADPVHVASRGGHPQLAQALVTGLRTRGWPDAERDGFTLYGASEVVEEAESARRRLVDALPDRDSRALLHRLSMVAGRFPRSVALAVAGVPPPAPLPGEHFDALVGPWVDQVGTDRFRVSPLLEGAGRAVLAAGEQVAVHRAVASAVVRRRSIDADQADNAFLHGIQGGDTRALLRLSIAVAKAPRDKLRALRRHLLSLTFAATDRPVYAQDAQTSLMLRLAQFELAQCRGASEHAAGCARALVREARGASGLAEAPPEVALLGKVLAAEGLSGFMPEWPDLLTRFLRLSRTAPADLAKALAAAPGGHEIAAFLFGAGLAGLRSVAALASAFERLDACDAAVRASMLSPVQDGVVMATLAMTPWWREREAGSLDPAAAAELYRRTALRAAAWGQRDWAIALHVALAGMFAEAVGDRRAALEALDSAVAELGDAPRLRRARAKAHFQNGDDAQVVRLVASLAGAFAADPLERAFLLREGAVSAGRLGEHARSAVWFVEASHAAASVDLPHLRAMAVGLAADAAAAAWRAGDKPAALERMVAALDDLGRLDPGSHLQAGYTHRVVRHALLWFLAETGRPGVAVDGEPPALPPGTCSNPAPLPAVLALPSVSLDIGWYLLAEIAVLSGLPEQAPDLTGRLRDGPVRALELGLRKSRLDLAIERSEAAAFVSALPPWLDAALLVPRLRAQADRGAVFEWERGTIPTAGPEAAGAVAALLRDAVLCFGIVAAASGKVDAIDRLGEGLAAQRGDGLPGADSFPALFRRDGLGRAGARTPDACAAVLAGGSADPQTCLEACLRLAVHLERSNHRQVATAPFARWVKKAWHRIGTQQRFAMRNPATTAPAVLAAAATPGDTLREVGAVLNAALPAVRCVLSDEMRILLKRLVSTDPDVG